MEFDIGICSSSALFDLYICLVPTYRIRHVASDDSFIYINNIHFD